ncbi:uncharacterized protein LOC135811388 [Sycon ciliatum]|uniref:uncharacterized protein LOC135811388 n=1 Tax=Sycon ciliatum TaxID=27933 RepID=UPI0031F6476C
MDSGRAGGLPLVFLAAYAVLLTPWLVTGAEKVSARTDFESTKLKSIDAALHAISARLQVVESQSEQSAIRASQAIVDLARLMEQSLSSKLDEQEQRLQSSIQQEIYQVQRQLHKLESQLSSYPRSCKDILEGASYPPPSGLYDIIPEGGASPTDVIKVHCDMERSGGGWTRIAYINPSQQGQCPGNMRYQNHRTNLCTRQANSSGSCNGASFQSPIGEYSEVMGFVTGYRDHSTNAFFARLPLETFYVDGVSITQGTPMEHIWTYAVSDTGATPLYSCPCSRVPGRQSPAFVGSHYYCTDYGRAWQRWTFSDDHHLWSNTARSVVGGSCTDSTLPMPWFHRQLTGNTTAPVQVRICADSGTSDENVGIDEAAIFVR